MLTAAQAVAHPQALARRAPVEVAGVTQPTPAPHFSRSGEATPAEPATPGRDTDAILADLGLAGDERTALRAAGVVA